MLTSSGFFQKSSITFTKSEKEKAILESEEIPDCVTTVRFLSPAKSSQPQACEVSKTFGSVFTIHSEGMGEARVLRRCTPHRIVTITAPIKKAGIKAHLVKVPAANPDHLS